MTPTTWPASLTAWPGWEVRGDGRSDQRERGGESNRNSRDVAISMWSLPRAWWLNEGYQVGRTARSGYATQVPFPTDADQRWLDGPDCLLAYLHEAHGPE